MIATTLNTIQTEFQNNWALTPVQFGDQGLEPTTEEWIRVEILPISSINASYAGNLSETHGLYVTSFARNQVQASELADSVTVFIQNRLIDNISVKNYQAKFQGPIIEQSDTHGKYFIKVFYEMTTTCIS